MPSVTELSTEVLVIGSGAGGAVTAALLAEAGRSVTVLEEGPDVDPEAAEPFSLEEMRLKYRSHGLTAALGTPGVAYAEGRCVGGSTEINSGLYRRLPSELADEWADAYEIDEFGADRLDAYAGGIERFLGVSGLPGAPPPASAILEHGASKLGWRSMEFERAFRYEPSGRAVKQTMARTFIPRARDAGALVMAGCRATRLERRAGRVIAARCTRTRPDGSVEHLRICADEVFVCAGAIQTPALLRRSRVRHQIGNGLRFHPTIKVAARFPKPVDHGDVPMHRVTEFGPFLTIGGSASRRGHVALALADASVDHAAALADWERVAVYYAAIRGGAGRVVTVPGFAGPVVTYRLTDADMSRLARGLVHLGAVLLAAGATELYPGLAGGPVVRQPDELVRWWDGVRRQTANVMTVHLTSTVRMGEDRAQTGADSFGRVWDVANLRVNDASLLPDAPGVNPQAAIMAIASRNCAAFLAG